MRTLKTSRRCRRPSVERLDDRCLLAGGLGASLVDGVLTIVGTPGDDQVTVNVTPGGGVTARRAFARAAALGAIAPRSGIVSIAGVGRFRLSQINFVIIGTGDGNDRIVINDRGLPAFATFLDAGSGDDTVIGGAADDAILGGDGNDTIEGGGGKNVILAGSGVNLVDGQIVALTPAPVSRPIPTPTPTPAPPPAPAPPPIVIPPPPSSPSIDLAAWASRIVDLTNQQRVSNGLAPLAVNSKLMQMASIQANQMAQLDTMQHELPDAQYPDLRSRAQAVGYAYARLGENIAFNYPDPEGVVQGWMLSSGHRANILNATYTEIGVAVALNADGRPYFAQEFGQPA